MSKFRKNDGKELPPISTASLPDIVFMLLFFFNSYSAGLSYYYFVANMITFGQQYSMRFFINESAIRAKIENNKAKGGKKGGFQAKLQNMMEEQQNGGNRRIRRNNK